MDENDEKTHHTLRSGPALVMSGPSSGALPNLGLPGGPRTEGAARPIYDRYTPSEPYLQVDVPPPRREDREDSG